MPIDLNEARRIAGKAVRYDGIYCDAVADAILAVQSKTAEECAAISEGYPHCKCDIFCEGYGCHSFRRLADKIRAAFGLEKKR